MNDAASICFFFSGLIFAIYAIQEYETKKWGYMKISLSLSLASFLLMAIQLTRI